MCKILTSQAEKIYKQFGDAIYSDYISKRYGLKTCSKTKDLTLITLREEILSYQLNSDEDVLSFVSHNFSLKDPIYYQEPPTSKRTYNHVSTPVCYVDRPNCATNSCLNSYLNVDQGNGNSNVVEINSGGCITRINLNNTVNVRSTNYTWIQETPSADWDIQHMMGFNPNVRVEDTNGVDIEGVIEYLTVDRLKIHFSNPIAGKAYLS